MDEQKKSTQGNSAKAKKPAKTTNQNDDGDSKANKTSAQEAEKQEPTSPPWIVYRSRKGLKLLKSFQEDMKGVCKEEKYLEEIGDVKTNRVESVNCSEDGQLVAWCDNQRIKCLNFTTNELVFDQQNIFKSNCDLFVNKSIREIFENTSTRRINLN